MPLKFAANISFMFQEHKRLPDRYIAAKSAGFRAVECGLPYDYSVEELMTAKQKANLEHVLINTPSGDLSRQELGLAAIPAHQEEFLSSLDLAIKYAKALNCEKIHIYAGKMPLITDDAMGTTFHDNLAIAAQKLKEERMVGLIQPMNTTSVPRYYMSNFDEAIHVIESINSANLRLLVDVYHLQILAGNLTNKIRRVLPIIGHVQIAQVPDRHEPNTLGEINYQYMFNLFEELGYSGWMGCEYIPRRGTVEGLSWVKEFGLHL